MGLESYFTPGPGSTGEYMASGIPWVTASTVQSSVTSEIRFPFVTRFFTIRNNGPTGSFNVGFTSNGLLPTFGNYFTVGAGESVTLDLRVTKLFLSASSGGNPSFYLVAGLTRIPHYQFPIITGSTDMSGAFPGVG